MSFRRCFSLAALVLAGAMMAARVAAAAPVLTSAVSRLAHGGQTFDVALPLGGGSGIECRSVTDGTTIVLTFSEPIESAEFAITAGGAVIRGEPAISGNNAAVTLAKIPDGSTVTIRAAKVRGASGVTREISVQARFLFGDVNADGRVDENDSSTARAEQRVVGGNFRSDVDRNGIVNRVDDARIRGRIGHTIAGGAAANTAPALRATESPRIVNGQRVLTVPIEVADGESPADSLIVWAKSENPSILPSENISVSGAGPRRLLTLSPTGAGDAMIVVFASDGLAVSSARIATQLRQPATLYAATLRPQGGAATNASGVSTLQLAPDELSAVIRYSFSNLTSPNTANHVHGPADPGQPGDILFDFDTATPNPDGSYTWVFEPVGSHSVEQIVNAIKQGRTYVNVHSGNYPDGEIRGHYLVVNGSTTFTPPDAPPPLPAGPPTDSEAARFLVQSTFGPTEEMISQVRAAGFDAWLEQQFNLPATSHLAKLMERGADGDTLRHADVYTETWWRIALTSNDQLRQRVAFALSQIFVISQVDGDLSNVPQCIASYYDILVRNAFGNYRRLIEEVTLHPGMGIYLDMQGSKKANAAGTVIPNENFARELLQLFSIGLYKMHPDGTLVLDQNGLPIPTYDQTVLSGIFDQQTGTYTQHGLAAALTGWNWHQVTTFPNPPINHLDPMTPIPNDHETAAKVIFDGIVIPAGQTARQDLAQVLNHVHNHPNTGPFICRRLIQRLVCDNPSPGYVHRVSQVFADNGEGVRGDLRAVIKAILTDYEARAAAVQSYQGYGKLKEPVLRTTQLMRALHVTSNSGQFRIAQTDTVLGQSPMKSPTVFNFFEPDYVHPGALAANGLVAPEFQIATETTNITAANFFWDGIRRAHTSELGGAFSAQNWNSLDVRLNLLPEAALAGNPAALVDRLNKILMAGQMSEAMKQRIITHVNSISASDTMGRAKAAIQLVVTSPDFAFQK